MMEDMNEEMQPMRGSIEAKDEFAVAPPGHSLTVDNTRWAWGNPPVDVDPEIVLTKAISSLKKRKVRDEMTKLLLTGVSVETMVEGYILQGFHEGRFTPDVGLLIKPALATVIAGMAEEDSIPYRMFENKDAGDEDKMDDKTFFRMLKVNNPRMFSFIKENINETIREGNKPPEENFLNAQLTTEEEEQ
jgi:hypothetical protein